MTSIKKAKVRQPLGTFGNNTWKTKHMADTASMNATIFSLEGGFLLRGGSRDNPLAGGRILATSQGCRWLLQP
jgi:hypothetical protein